MKDTIKKLIEQSVTIDNTEPVSDLEARKESVEDEFYSFFEEKGIDRSDASILSISDMVVEFVLSEAPDYVFYQAYSFDNEEGKVNFDDLDLKKKLIENPSEDIAAVGDRDAMIESLVISLKDNKLLESANTFVKVFDQTLRLKKHKMAYTTLSESAKEKGKKIALQSLKESTVFKKNKK